MTRDWKGNKHVRLRKALRCFGTVTLGARLGSGVEHRATLSLGASGALQFPTMQSEPLDAQIVLRPEPGISPGGCFRKCGFGIALSAGRP